MNYTMRPITEADGTRKVSLGEGLVFPLDSLPPDLKRRWSVAMSHLERGNNISGAIKAMTREALEALWPDIMARVAHKAPQSVLNVGLIEGSGEVITDLSALAAEYARKEREKEGVKSDAAEPGTRDRKTRRQE
jgi:hypothetical protein